MEGPDGRVQALSRTPLGGDGPGWNRHDFARSALAKALILSFEPNSAGAVLREMEIWGRPAAAAEVDTTAVLPDVLYSTVPDGARELDAAPVEQTIGTAGTFVVQASAVRTFDRAFLVYELSGLPHFTAALDPSTTAHRWAASARPAAGTVVYKSRRSIPRACTTARTGFGSCRCGLPRLRRIG